MLLSVYSVFGDLNLAHYPAAELFGYLNIGFNVTQMAKLCLIPLGLIRRLSLIRIFVMRSMQASRISFDNTSWSYLTMLTSGDSIGRINYIHVKAGEET